VWHELLAAQVTPVLLPVLMGGLRHEDGWVRAAACRALFDFDRAAAPALPELRRVLAGDAFRLVRRHAAEVLCRIGPAAVAAVPELVAALRDREELDDTRCSAACARVRSV
jgi:hypothetical protein